VRVSNAGARLPDASAVVVVGGGTAGCVVAGRLAESGHQVLVLEAGPDYGSFDEGRWPADLLNARTLPLSHDWNYEGPGLGGHLLPFHRARVIGGCSAHNGCSQMVGWGADYDLWGKDAAGWGAEGLRPLFEVSRKRMRMREWGQEEIQPLQRAFMDAARAMGLPVSWDFDDLGAGESVGCAPVNIVEGVRWNSSFAYLDPVRGTGSLTVAGGVAVDRVLTSGGLATGVEVRSREGTSRVWAGHIVICAGAYGTPEILLRSGIGPAGELRSAGIDVAADLPGVGGNLHDHPVAQLEFEGTRALASDLSDFSREHWLPEEQAVAKIASTVCDGPYDLHVFPWVEQDPALAHGWKVVVPVGLVTPRSRGRVTLRSSGPFATGNIDHGYLREHADVSALTDGVRWAQELIGSAPAFGRYLGRSLSAPSRGADAITTWIRRCHQHYWHPAGSCRIGRAGDPGAVVGPDGAVHGISGLSIADATIFPQIPRATIAWPVVAVGERIARLVNRRLAAG
jgi:choline dehydrogenase